MGNGDRDTAAKMIKVNLQFDGESSLIAEVLKTGLSWSSKVEHGLEFIQPTVLGWQTKHLEGVCLKASDELLTVDDFRETSLREFTNTQFKIAEDPENHGFFVKHFALHAKPFKFYTMDNFGEHMTNLFERPWLDSDGGDERLKVATSGLCVRRLFALANMDCEGLLAENGALHKLSLTRSVKLEDLQKIRDRARDETNRFGRDFEKCLRSMQKGVEKPIFCWSALPDEPGVIAGAWKYISSSVSGMFQSKSTDEQASAVNAPTRQRVPVDAYSQSGAPAGFPPSRDQ